MSTHPPPAPANGKTLEIVRHLEFLRAIARRCTKDAGLADDLVQDAALIALSTEHGPDRNVRGWLFAVVRRLAARHHRTERRRHRRESVAARPDAVESQSRLIARRDEHVQRMEAVFRALHELPSPYCEMLCMRYLQQMPPRQMAEHLGIPRVAVKTRLVRGLRMLRGNLKRQTLAPRHGAD